MGVGGTKTTYTAPQEQLLSKQLCLLCVSKNTVVVFPQSEKGYFENARRKQAVSLMETDSL